MVASFLFGVPGWKRLGGFPSPPWLRAGSRAPEVEGPVLAAQNGTFTQHRRSSRPLKPGSASRGRFLRRNLPGGGTDRVSAGSLRDGSKRAGDASLWSICLIHCRFFFSGAHFDASFAATAIYFLITAGNFSAFHRIKSDEGWHFYTGDSLLVHVIKQDGSYEKLKIGADIANGEVFQAHVAHGCWFASETEGEYSLVGCTVSPGFDFSDFELAKGDELAKEHPQHAEVIKRLCRQ